MVRVAERIRSATTLTLIAQCAIEEIGTFDGVLGCAFVFCDGAGVPALWIGDVSFDRVEVHAYLDGGHRDDACFARACTTYVAQSADDLWVAPLLGADGVNGMLRVRTAPGVDRNDLTTIAAYVSIRIAILGIAVDTPRSLDSLTKRQREVAELVAHGCTNLEIADMLSISANAVKKHVSRVLVALDVSNRTELAALTGRWRTPSGAHHVVPPTLYMAVRNPVKSIAAICREEVA